MTFGQLLARFWADDKVAALVILGFLDITLGSLAAWKVGNFRLSYLVDFLRNDVAFKMVPYFVVYAGALLTNGNDVILGVVDLGDVAMTIYGGLLIAWGASIANSLLELKQAPKGAQTLTTALAGSENAAPPKD